MLDELRERGIARLAFDRDSRLNSFTASDYRDLRLALRRLRDDGDTRAVLRTGRGRAFSAGADRSLSAPTLGAQERQRAGAECTGLLDTLMEFDKPIVAAVNGVAVGFGVTLPLYCDVVFMADTATLRLPFTSPGIVPEAGSGSRRRPPRPRTRRTRRAVAAHLDRRPVATRTAANSPAPVRVSVATGPE